MKKILVILLIIAGIGGGYWFFRAKNIYLFTPHLNGSGTDGRVRSVTGLFNNAEDTVTSFVSQKSKEAENVSGNALYVAAKKGASVIAEARNSLAEKLGNIARDVFTAAVDRGGKFMGVATNTVEYGPGARPVSAVVNKPGDVVSSLLGAVVKRGQPLTFVISEDLFKNNNVSEASYTIFWGDGGEEYQKIYAAAKNKFVMHTFQKTGEYKSKFIFDIGGSKIQYEISVIVE